MIDAYEDTTGPMAEVEILAQVHDSILFQYPYYKGDVLAAPRNLAKCILYIADYLNPELEYNGRRFKIKSDLKVGTIWGTMKEVEIGTEAKGLAHRLSQIL